VRQQLARIRPTASRDPRRRPMATAGATSQPSKPVVAYILAASHSGSTLLAMLLASHPEVCTTGELKAQSLGDPDRYPLFVRCVDPPVRVLERHRRPHGAPGHVFDITRSETHLTAGTTPYVQKLLQPLVRGAALETLRDAGLGRVALMAKTAGDVPRGQRSARRSVCDRTGTRVVVDSSKVGIRLKYLLRNPGIDVRVIRLIRDGRAVALTYIDPENFADATAPELRGGGDGTSRDKERLKPWDAAHEWRRSNEEADAVVASLDPAQYTTVTYEDLCASTPAVLSKIWEFVGVSPFSFGEGWRARNHHVIGNGMRLRFERRGANRRALEDRPAARRGRGLRSRSRPAEPPPGLRLTQAPVGQHRADSRHL